MINQPMLKRIDHLRSHPKNYRNHPQDQIEHIKESINANGVYRNIVVANDFTILAGHGVIEACRQLGLVEVPVVVLPYGPDSPQAMKVMAGDNEIARLGEIDDRVLSEILRDINEHDDLLGTGFDEMTLSSLVMISRTSDEIADIDEAKEWVGMPDYKKQGDADEVRLTFIFDDSETRDKFIKKYKVKISTQKKNDKHWTTRWPYDGKNDIKSVKFESDDN